MKAIRNISLILAGFGMAFSVFAYEITEKNERSKAQTKIDAPGTNVKQPPPNEKYRVHDPDRPQPPVAEPKYDGKPVAAPEGATIVFNGNIETMRNKKWKVVDGVMIAGGGGQNSLAKFGDGHYHVEWLVPTGLKGFGQKQGNSGVFIMNKYEIQVLNCWASRTYPDGMTGAIYGQQPPMFNACRKPGEWQAYDIHFKAPVFGEDKKLKSSAYVTVFLNGVKIHDNQEVRGPTVYRRLPQYKYHGDKDVIQLQSHGSPVNYRNIWVAPLKVKLGK